MTPDFTASDPGPGLIAFLVVLFLCVATGLLLWSMLRQMRKVPKDLDVPLHPRGELPPLLDPSTGAGHRDTGPSEEAGGTPSRGEASADDE